MTDNRCSPDIVVVLEKLRLKAFASNSEDDRKTYFDRLSLAYQRGELVAAPVGSDFACKVCGDECPIAPSDGSGAVCEKHCPDHEYEYQRGEGHHCIHCFKERPND